MMRRAACKGNYAAIVKRILPCRSGGGRFTRGVLCDHGRMSPSTASGYGERGWPGPRWRAGIALDIRQHSCIIRLTVSELKKEVLSPVDEEDEKRAALRARHALHPHPEAVTDPLFVAGDPFFDARDLVQVKYEMLRRVQHEGASVTSAAQAFGLSRPAFYAAQRAWEQGGLPALVPARPGPRRAHKLGEEVVAYLVRARAADPQVRADELAQQVQARFGLQVHPRSIERALARRSGSRAGPAPRPPASGPRRAG
jgi:transposase